MSRTTWTGVSVALLTLAWTLALAGGPATSVANANPKVNANEFRVSVHPEDILGIQTTFIPKSTQWGAGLWMTLRGQTLTLVDPSDNSKVYGIVKTRFMMDFVGSFGIGNWVDVGLALPLAYTLGEKPVATAPLQTAQGFDLGDMRIGLKVKLFPERLSGFGLALSEDVSVPTATAQHFFGDHGATATTQVVLDYLFPKDWLLAFNIGYRAKTDVRLVREKMDDRFIMGLGFVGPVYKDILELLGTMEVRTAANDPFGSEYHDSLDLMAGARIDLAKFGRLGDKGHVFYLTAAGGAGALNGWGTPLYQATLGLTYMFHKPRACRVLDRDEDGVRDDQDKCPLTPGLMAFAGCPDSDGDGIPDDQDQCPAEPGPASTQGCPDRDSDGVRDAVDVCPDIPGLKEKNGCPDSDGDGILDKDDICPTLAGIPAAGGCPDTDGDTVIDPEDDCPDVVGKPENNGCPTKGETSRHLKAFADEVYFKTGSAKLTRDGKKTVDKVAKMLKATKDWTLLQIVGHTDDVGAAPANLKLSQDRANTVLEALTSRGIDMKKLSATGKGEESPVAPNTTNDGRQKNRRVEFLMD